MSAKRFIQLFICYAISMIVAILLTDLFNFSSPIAYLVVASIIGYVVITVPLTIMTLLKNKNYDIVFSNKMILGTNITHGALYNIFSFSLTE